ncbi:hypothetical protein [Herbaspirillum rubrisubalbicans]|uniref:hypothetical protein n=1 Tax=Herbaspirillum rubrisubalbicans TaxID=80842 RepID=UPI0012E3DB0C|nr:hypothetical protein [Herbaspirillum rubrisubalbicans]
MPLEGGVAEGVALMPLPFALPPPPAASPSKASAPPPMATGNFQSLPSQLSLPSGPALGGVLGKGAAWRSSSSPTLAGESWASAALEVLLA